MEQDNSLNTLLNSAGTNQQQRFWEALETSYIKLDERSRKDLLQYVYELAEVIKFYDVTNNPSGKNWQDFFSAFHQGGSLPKLSTLNKQLETTTDLEPLLALLFAFIEMLTCAQDSINQLTEKHLDYYYRQVLQLTEKPAIPDEVHFIFELAKNVRTHLIKEGTQVLTKAVDEEELPIIYEIPGQVVLNKAQAVDFRSVRLETVEVVEDMTPIPMMQMAGRPQGDDDQSAGIVGGSLGRISPSGGGGRTDLSQGSSLKFSVGNVLNNPNIPFLGVSRGISGNTGGKPAGDKVERTTFLSAPVAKSNDGLGEELEGDEPKWFPFGQSRAYNPAAMLDGRVGFLIADPILRLNEGERIVSLTISCESSTEISTVLHGINITYSGAEQWEDVSAYMLDEVTAQATSTKAISSPGDPTRYNVTIEISFTLPAEAPAVVDYLEEIHVENLSTSWPVLKFELQNTVALQEDDGTITDDGIDNNAFDTLKSLTFSSIDITTQVNGLRNLILQNDQAVLDPGKPFMPFGAQPKLGSSFYFGSDEVFQKDLQALCLNWEWESPPEELAVHYGGYASENEDGSGKKLYCIDTDSFLSQIEFLQNGQWAASMDSPEFDKAGNLTSPTPGVEPFKIFKLDANNLTDANRSILIAKDLDNNTAIPGKTVEGYLPFDFEGSSPASAALSTFDHNTKTGFGRLNFTSPKIKTGGTETKAIGGTNYDFTFEYGFEAFGHKAFPGVFADVAITAATSPNQFTGSLPNSPYTPVFRSFSLDYVAKSKIENKASSNGQFFQLEPFGHAEITPKASDSFILPQYEGLGHFYIGLSDLQPPQNINLLFQIAEGSSLDSQGLDQGDISWHYLSNENVWEKLEGTEIISNDTRELQKSGIISFAIPKDASHTQKRMPAGMHWLKAELSSELSPDRASQLIDVHAQAIKATLLIEEGRDTAFDTHLSTSLASESVDTLLIKDAAVKAITQPYTSFDGRPMEKTETFNTRVSERLRHRNRALSPWDYERLTLETFPEVFKVRCLNHVKSDDLTVEAIACRSCNEPPEPAPCYATVVIVSNLRNKNAVNPLEPKTSIVKLQEIEEYLHQYTSLFTNLAVINPLYERIQADFSVKFHDGYDEGFYTAFLNEELVKFLSPWAFEEGKDIAFGGKIYRSDILAFIETRDYVDYVSDFKLYQFIDSESDDPSDLGGICYMKIGTNFIVRESPVPTTGRAISEAEVDPYKDKDLEIAEASSLRSILVSHPEHRITSISPATGDENCENDFFLGIGTMVVRSTFSVSSKA